MDQDHEDYADLDLPAPRQRPPLESIFGLLGTVFIGMMVVAFLFLCWAGQTA